MRILYALLMTTVLTAADYSPLRQWSGSGTKDTETFEVTAKEWRLSWTAQPVDKTFAGDGRFVFRVTVYKDGSDVPVSRIEGGQSEQRGESFVRGAGRYYLKVSAVNAQWTLTAEEP